MQLSTIILTALAALASAAPATPVLEERAPRAYSCDVSNLSPPAAPTPLSAPASGAKVILVAIGKGTQNYSCADSNPTTVPSAVGALANLYNASCLAAASQSYLNTVTQWANQVSSSALAGLPTVGQHYFVDTTTPTFGINSVGTTECKKGGTSDAPTNSDNDVPWLYLTSQTTGTTDKVTTVYRVETQGGSAPATCSGVTPGVFTVPYTAQYWFFST
jgi:Protein of unknown function (DUF3455)